MEKTYILQELHVMYYKIFWFDVYYSDDLEFIKNMKIIYSRKYQSNFYRIVEAL